MLTGNMAGEARAPELICDAALGEDRIERLRSQSGDECIRFVAWEKGKYTPTPPVLSEPELLDLLQQAIRRRVLSEHFVDGLDRIIAESHQPLAVCCSLPSAKAGKQQGEVIVGYVISRMEEGNIAPA